ncbi:unnamed protein product (macronuclear) [Paramecium tetraurelia]|uniref:Endo-1,4-beta-xylanase xylA n=1 Tax=Paramecium tetraurelia TaxID=5888 RepID=A0BCD4_PARTE|nr:uncharacterized protein GSPATT00004295001 [Paramecium tetraurelia]CAK56201.1 unnamed protein product [Paramecium tetraurelia]|eukprot:XP_001423599.1 hypothetical protein (macronuclear) [Paramecium tetraurelia strain d4-2]
MLFKQHQKVQTGKESIMELKSINVQANINALSFQLSSISFKVSSITMNPFSYEHITQELLQREYLQSKPFQILNKQEFIRIIDHPTKSSEITPQSKIIGQGTLNQQWNQDKHVIDDFEIDQKQGSNSTKYQSLYKQDKNNTKLYQLKEDQMQLQKQINHQYKRSNGQSIKNEKTENFSDEESAENNSLSISQNFAELKQNEGEIDEKSYLQNNRFWSSDHSSTFIDFQFYNQNINSQYNNQSEKYLVGPNLKQLSQAQSSQQNLNQRVINQQSFGTIKTVIQNQQPQIQHLTTSPTVFSQNKLLKQTQPQNYQIFQQQIPLESHQHFGYTQLHSNKKLNSVNHQQHTNSPNQQWQNNNNLQNNQIIGQQQQQGKKSKFHHSASPQAQIPQSQGQQKESMRQQFDRLLRDNKEFKSKQKTHKEENIQNCKSPRLADKKKDQNQNINKKQIQSPKDDKASKKQKLISSQSPLENKGIIKNSIGYVEMNKIKKQYHRSPEQDFERLQNQRQVELKIQDKQKDNHLYSKQFHFQIQNLPLQSFEHKTLNIQQTQNKQNVSNLQTAMTQNISPSERGVTNRPNIKDIINLNDLSQYQENYINFDRTTTNRETQIQKVRKFSD